MLSTFLKVSAAGFYVLLGLLGLGAWKVRRELNQIEIAVEDLREEALGERDADQVWDPANWTWIVDEEETGEWLPLYVPDDVADKALEVLGAETVEEHQALKAQGWRWIVSPMQMRHAMHIAQNEENIEVAMFTWLANTKLPKADD